MKKYKTGPATKKLQPESRFDTVVHGDLWLNNLMFHRDGGEEEQLKILDFGSSAYTHPAFDIIYFLYVNTDREFRRSHSEDLLRQYFEVYSRYLPDDDPELTSFDKFKEELEERREPVLLMATSVCTIVKKMYVRNCRLA